MFQFYMLSAVLANLSGLRLLQGASAEPMYLDICTCGCLL